ncbi:TSUP family transporter [Flaviaesturariibacter amylovorans]|uniref:Probable membrane transporter protein n=1 Tax=Flaviaesturariibacter amylovorans TaxID=1084520 RepID=A0ABP8H0J5_9BACT
MMKHLTRLDSPVALPITLHAPGLRWLLIGGGQQAAAALEQLLVSGGPLAVTVIAPAAGTALRTLLDAQPVIEWQQRDYTTSDLHKADLLIAATDDPVRNGIIRNEAADIRLLVYVPDAPEAGDFSLLAMHRLAPVAPTVTGDRGEAAWKRIASRLIIAFGLMVLGHVLISYLPIPPVAQIWRDLGPTFTGEFWLFVLAGFVAQLVDGLLSMGYGVTSATCLMSFGVSPVAVSAAIHTSEVFTTGISGYSHYKFGNVNKKLFRHLVIPGVLGAILGAVALVYLGERSAKWLMPVIALYAGFLGLKILVKAFQAAPGNRKVKRVGWLAGAGGFLDSFGGGGWGPIVTSTLIAKGRSPKYTVGSVSLTEFFVTLASAFTFLVTVGVSHLGIVLGLLIGGVLAAPVAARLAGRLPRRTMMICVGIMVMVWCVRVFLKSI